MELLYQKLPDAPPPQFGDPQYDPPPPQYGLAPQQQQQQQDGAIAAGDYPLQVVATTIHLITAVYREVQ